MHFDKLVTQKNSLSEDVEANKEKYATNIIRATREQKEKDSSQTKYHSVIPFPQRYQKTKLD